MKRELIATKRETQSKSTLTQLRKTGYVPAVMYGKTDPVALTVSNRDIRSVLHSDSEHSILSLVCDGVSHDVLIKDYQIHPVSREYYHVDFQEIRQDVAIRTQVSLHLVGSSVGVRQGGILEHHLHELEIECLPKDLPETIDVNVEELDVGHSIHVGVLELAEEIRVLSDSEQVIALVSAPKQEVEEEELEEVIEEEEAEAEEEDSE